MRSIIKLFRNFSKSVKFKYFSLFLISLSALVLFFFMHGTVKNETFELKQFQIAPEAVRSVKTVEDTVKTEQERERAELDVAPVYLFSEDAAKNREAIATNIFEYLKEVKKGIDNDSSKPGKPIKIEEKAIAEMQGKLTSLVEEEPNLRLKDEVIANLLLLDDPVLNSVEEEIIKLVGEALSKPVKIIDLMTTKDDIERQIRLSNTIPSNIEQAAIQIAQSLIIETEVVSEELTEIAREEARAAVEPIKILQGQVIVREGQVVDNEVYRQLELAGLLKTQTTVKPMAGLILFVLFIGIIIFMHFSTWREESMIKKKSLTIVLVVFFIQVILMKIITLIEPEFEMLIAFLLPTALASMLVKTLTNERLAIMTTIITAATAGVMLQDGYAMIIQMEVALYILFGGLVSLYLLENTSKRLSILRTSLGVAASNVLFLSFYLLMTQSSYSYTELMFYAVAAITSGLLSGALTIGLLPFFETSFGLLSDLRLIELSNPNHPLFKKILVETPGTYHHSVMVANLADAACEAIGANGLLARVGSYYHDIGKTVKPGYFIENQHKGKNPHDQLTPEESRDIIIAHAVDGAEILRKYKMPVEIIDIAAQHHGTGLIKYFLHKARQVDEHVSEDDYRYPGPKPQTKEIGIILIADNVEAAVRSMNEPTSEKIAALVESIVFDKLNDGQFDECDLSMKDLKKAKHAICEALNGIFHNRIEYPD